MTLEEYNKLKQKVITLRQAAVSAQGSEAHAKITDNSVEQNIISKLDMQDNSNIIQKPLRR